MARIEGVPEPQAGWFARSVYRYARKRLRKVPEPLAVMAHHNWVLAASGAFEMALERCRKLDERVKALAEIKAATMVGCPF